MLRQFKILLISTLILFLNNGQAQTYSLSGKVQSTSNELLPYANCIIRGHALYASTDENGYFKINAPKGKYTLEISYSGYETQQFDIDLNTNINRVFVLNGIALEGVEIVSEVPLHRQSLLGKIKLSQNRVLTIPTTLGEEDLIKVLGTLPGVHASTKGQSAMSVRGGGRYGNMFLIDNVPVYNHNHLFGILSMFNTDALESLDFYKGGFPAKYGGYSSSVTDIKLKAGQPDTIHAGFNIGILKTKAYLNGGVGKKLMYSITARTSYINAFYESFRKITDISSTNTKYAFYDLNAKITYQLNDKHKISLASFYSVDDLHNFDDSDSTAIWDNAIKHISSMYSLHDQFIINKTSILKSTLSYTRLDLISEESTTSGTGNEKQGIKNYSTATNENIRWFSELVNNHFDLHEIRTGIELNNLLFRPSTFHKENYNDDFSKTKANKKYMIDYAVFVQDEVQLSSKSKLNAGIRLSLFRNDKSFFSLQPRLSYRYAVSENYSLKLSYARMVQNFRSIDNNMQGFGKEFFLSSSKIISPELSDLYAIGFSGIADAARLEFNSEIYYRRTKDQLYFLYNPLDNLSLHDLEHLVYKNGKGVSKGFELSLKYYGIDKLGLTASYTLSRSTVRFEQLNEGKEFATTLDHLHDLKLGINYKFNKSYELNAQWFLASGNPITLPSAYVANSPYTSSYFVYDGINSHRLPPYHRLDIGFKKRWKSKKGWDKYFSIGIYNAYLRTNPTYIHFNGGKMKKIDVIPPLLSLNYGIKF